jgi:PAS domain S-box-containing protein
VYLELMSMGLMTQLNFQKKLLIFIMAMVLFMGGTMGLLIRVIIFPYLEREMKTRGFLSALKLAENAKAFVLVRDKVSLTALIFDEKHLEPSIAYIIVTDDENRLLAHTFLGTIPETDTAFRGIAASSDKKGSGPLVSAALSSHVLKPDARVEESEIVMPVHEGLYRIGTIRIGQDVEYINRVINKFSLFHLGFTGFITLSGFLFGLYISKIITRPITALTTAANEIARGNLNARITLGRRDSCWQILNCKRTDCPAYANDGLRCWFIDDTQCHGIEQGSDKLETCKSCPVYKQQAGDEFVQLADTFNHMTERLQQSQKELRRSEERYRLLFNTDPNPVFVVAADSQLILDVNDRAAEIYGYPKANLISMPFTSLGYADEGREIAEAFSRLSTEDKLCSQLPKMRRKASNGEVVWENIHFCRYRYMGKESIIATTSDITELIETETKLIQAGKMATLGEMSTGMAHELNQPLNAIKLGSEFLQKMIELEGRVPEEELLEVAADMSKEVDRATAIINHLRQFGRKSTIDKHKVDVNVPAQGVFSVLGQQLKVNNIKVALELGDNLPLILADENRLEQVFINLVINARDAMIKRRDEDSEAGPMVLTVRSFLENDMVTVTVSDTGTGIPAPVQARVFEPFYTTKEVGKGTGLGLSISYGIIRDFEGIIEFETKENVGTTFKVSFPKAPA